MKWPRREKRHRGKCDYCHKRRIIGSRTGFCRECLEGWDTVVDKYMDGDPFLPLKIAAQSMNDPEALKEPQEELQNES